MKKADEISETIDAKNIKFPKKNCCRRTAKQIFADLKRVRTHSYSVKRGATWVISNKDFKGIEKKHIRGSEK